MNTEWKRVLDKSKSNSEFISSNKTAFRFFLRPSQVICTTLALQWKLSCTSIHVRKRRRALLFKRILQRFRFGGNSCTFSATGQLQAYLIRACRDVTEESRNHDAAVFYLCLLNIWWVFLSFQENLESGSPVAQVSVKRAQRRDAGEDGPPGTRRLRLSTDRRLAASERARPAVPTAAPCGLASVCFCKRAQIFSIRIIRWDEAMWEPSVSCFEISINPDCWLNTIWHEWN